MLKSLVCAFGLSAASFAQNASPHITSFSPAFGPEGTRIEIQGGNLATAQRVFLGSTSALFRVNSNSSITALIPVHAPSAAVTVVTSLGRAESANQFRVENDPRIPVEVRYKTGYVNITPPPQDFRVALLWGIAIADTRVSGFESAEIEIASTELSCRINRKEVPLNRDLGRIRGGLYLRDPWFFGNSHEPMPPDSIGTSVASESVTLPVGRRADRIWHFWSASGRATIPDGHLEGCTARARVRISPGALLQLGMDYWRDQESLWAPHSLNNHEAGVSHWYFPSPEWQEVVFTDIP